MISFSWVCADSYFWKYLASLLPPGMKPRILLPTLRLAWLGVRSSTVLRSSPRVLATATWALFPDFLAPAMEVEERSSSLLEELLDAVISALPILLMPSTCEENSGLRASSLASPATNSLACLLISACRSSGTGTMPGASSG